MSSPSQAGASASKEEKVKKSLSSLLRRPKTVLKREGSSGSSSKRLSTISTSKPAPAGKSEPVKTSVPAVAEEKATDPWTKYEGTEGVSKLTKSQLIEERTKKLGERYGLDTKLSELQQTGSPDDTVLRMDKPIRTRVRRTCHKCNATFASAQECPNCQHARCTKCTRYPPKRTEAEIIASRERRATIIKANKENAPIIPDYSCAFDEKNIVLTRPSRTGGQDLFHKKPRRRVRRTCHECSTLFVSGHKTCEMCGHVRCTDCPRDPSKKEKYPFGYPGDEFGPNSVPQYECKECKTIFPTGAENGTKCKKCGLEKTDESPRALPRKVEPEPDPELLKKLEERLESLKVA